MKEQYDYVVIGSGPAGYVSAVKAAQAGLKTLVVERSPERVGGVCLNEGCIPAKSLFHSAGLYRSIICDRDLWPNGEELTVDIGRFVERSREAAERLKKGLVHLLGKYKVDLLIGKASFISRRELRVVTPTAEKNVLAADILIASGSHPGSLPGLKFDGKKVLSSAQAIALRTLPSRVLIVGGGAIGVEFASYFNIMGANVTLLEMADSILPQEDHEVARMLTRIFKKNGIKVRTGSSIKDAGVEKDSIRVFSSETGKDFEEFDLILVAVGRKSNTAALSLDRAGVELDENGAIKVNDRMQTSVSNIYAAGDVTGSPMLAHVAYAEGELAARAVAGEDVSGLDHTAIPNAVYSNVQIASFGMTEELAKEHNIDHNIGRAFFVANGKAVADSGTDGMVKVLTRKDTGEILGGHILHSAASELIHELLLAKKNGLTAWDISSTVHAHPTLSEAVAEASRSAVSRPLHA